MNLWRRHARTSRAAMALTLIAWVGRPVCLHALPLMENDSTLLELDADVKSFSVVTFPYAHPLLYPSTDPQGLGALDLRFKLEGSIGDHLRLKIHPKLTAVSDATDTLGQATRLGALPQPEAVRLSHAWPEATSAPERLWVGVDRLLLQIEVDHLKLTLGRQAISFGTTFFFSPTDLVSPFSATTLDREYKAGVDALRADLYFGETTTITLAAAYAGAWNASGLLFVGHAGTTLGGFDLGLFFGVLHEDLVAGLDAQGDLQGIGLRAEATLTRPAGGGDLFYRVVLGAEHTFAGDLRLSAELYAQSLGARRSEDYLAFALSDRVRRGEVWTLGRLYAAVALSWQAHPLLQVNFFGVANLEDPSLLLGPALTYAISDEVSLDLGLYLGAGARPAETLDGQSLDLGSEFGPIPATAFLTLRAYL